MSTRQHALYKCLHCNLMVYIQAASPDKPPCPQCLHTDYERVEVPSPAPRDEPVDGVSIRYLPPKEDK
ncbi:hypothetical protein SAMN02745148_02289 [Modicisalibacter ilicicola DSM 19980]|uniref:Uncharacterized protein n=1 Tax=Modicisalibacter ilicicola DSM 19980 TaxID=1121942 RepID=A0A1M5AKA7_9GAMM|nr:hypothetical protein SAMN02745148_02289 [Halomonas ilicicola DSM 19980]